MATLTQAQMADRVLEKLGVKGAGQTADADDADYITETIASVHAQLRKRGLADFSSTAIPDWAQTGLMKVLCAETAPHFGMDREAWRKLGEVELAQQHEAKKQPAPVRTRYF